MKRAPGKAEKLVAQFEAAVGGYTEIGAIPMYSGDREEQAAIDRERRRIKAAYTRTRNRLLKALETEA
jgi:hypothetical protein